MHAGIVSRLPATGCVHFAPSVRAGISDTHQPGGPAIHPYQIMMIHNPDADQEAQAEITSRVRTLVEEAGGTVTDIADWGRRPIAYPVRKHADGVFVIVTAEASSAAIDEVTRVLGISKDVVLRAMPFRLSESELEHVKANGVPLPVDDRPAEERPRGGRGGRGGGGGGGRRRDR